ncbi:MAG: DUF2059 domain-containing protein [Aquabacterium sp.]
MAHRVVRKGAAVCLPMLVWLTLASSPVHAQSAQSVSKQQLVERVITLWRPQDMVVMMVQRPAADALQQARIALQGRVTLEKRDAALKEMAVDAQKYVDEATPIALDSAGRNAVPILGPMLMQQFSEEELRQIIALLESPVKKKFEQMIPRMERALGEKVAAESRPQIDPKLQAMTQAVGLKLRSATVTP